MKILFDLFPIALFFGMFKYAGSHVEWAATTATEWLGFMVSGGQVGVIEAPVLLATVVVILATAVQIIWLAARGKKIETMLWVSLALVVVMGGATIYFHSENFIKWKPTMLYWVMGVALLVGQFMPKKNGIKSLMENGIKSLMGGQMTLPDAVLRRINFAWVGFFALIGALNLWVAFNFTTDMWVNFKLFGVTGLMLVFVLLQAVYLGRYMTPEAKLSDSSSPNSSDTGQA